MHKHVDQYTQEVTAFQQQQLDGDDKMADNFKLKFQYLKNCPSTLTCLDTKQH